MTQNKSFKNTYLVDMDKLSRLPFECVGGGAVLPIEKKNGIPVTDINEQPILFSERFVKKMIKRYPDLSAIIGDQDARTILEYMDNNGKSIMTLYPTNDVDLHTHNWDNIDTDTLPDMQKTINHRNMLIKKAHEK